MNSRFILVGLLFLQATIHAQIQYTGPQSDNFVIRWAFQELCDHHFDTRWVYPTDEDKSADFNPRDVKPGDLIFVRDFKYFFKHRHPKIKVPYFVLTHGEYLDRFKKKNVRYLNDKKILAWFTIHPCEVEHERVIPLPLGIVQFKGLRDHNHKVHKRFMKFRQKKRDKLLYMNFTEWHMPKRTRIRKLFETKPYCTYAERCEFNQFLSEMAEHKFALSPPGLGPDCYRVWECALMGTIPIVQHSHLDFMYEGLPVLFINDWEDVTEEFLNEKYKELTAKTYNQERLYMEYWIPIIDKVRKKYWPSGAGAFRRLSRN